MKNILTITFIAFLYACQSADNNSEQETRVNLIGTWFYTATVQNNLCNGIEAQGIMIVESLNGDLSRIGDILIQGESLDSDESGNCALGIIDERLSTDQGEPSSQTLTEYEDDTESHSDLIVSDTTTVFTENKIVQVTEFSTGAILTMTFTR